jgi:lipoprotein-anchoring transpeptidase ErfK/SrfK
MFQATRNTSAVAAAVGLGAVAVVATGDEPPAPPVPAPLPDPAANVAVASGGGPVARIPARPVAREKRRRGQFTILRVRRGKGVALRVGPGGRVAARVGSRTEFGSPQTLTVVKRSGRWVGVTASQRPNGKLAWVDGGSSAVHRDRTRVSLHVDLSRKRLELREGRRTRRSVRVGTGGASSPTPTGRFAVTDKLAGARFKGVYGCCILALSGRQPRTPPGWTGGDRLAIHGSSSPGRFTGSSAGCLRADARTLKKLMRSVPLGTPVFVSR